MAKKKVGYLRVSTAEQRPDRQIDALKPICDELHIEKLSAVAKHRPVFERVVSSLENGDFLVVWDLDRGFRSAKDALNHFDQLRDRGVGIQIASLQIDTSTPHGKLIYTFISGLAEFERSTLSLRTKQGLEATRRRGTKLGQPPKMTDQQIKNAIKKLKGLGATKKSVAQFYGVHPWTLTRAIKRYEAKKS